MAEHVAANPQTNLLVVVDSHSATDTGNIVVTGPLDGGSTSSRRALAVVDVSDLLRLFSFVFYLLIVS